MYKIEVEKISLDYPKVYWTNDFKIIQDAGNKVMKTLTCF